MSRPRTLELPDGVHRVTVSTPRGEVAGLDARPGGEARGHVLLVPGFTGSKEDFTTFLPLLAAAGWHATTYDQRGHAESPAGDDPDYSLAGLAADALAVRQVASEDRPASVVVGHSFGGLVAQEAVVADPSAWQTVVLLCTGPGGNRDERTRRRLGRFLEAVPAMGLEAVYDRDRDDETLDPGLRQFLRHRFLTTDADAHLALAHHLLDAPDRTSDVAATGVPVHVVRGVDDDAWPHADQDDQARRLGGRTVVVPDSAHSPAVENPDGFAAALLPLLG